MAYTSSSSFSPTSSRSSFLRPFSPKVLEHISTPSTVSCKATNDLDPKNPTTRRDVLLGLGGLYYASSTLCDASANDAKAVSAVDRTGRGRGDLGPGKAAPAAETKNMVLTAISAFPLDLDRVVSTEVSRPKKSRSKKEKEDEEEVLVIEGIDFERGEFVKFDVYVNDDGDPSPRGPNKAEFAGSFVNVPHTSRTKGNKASLTLAINELLNNLEAEDDDSVVVTLVPRSGKGPVIGGVKIEYVKE
ncbi:polyphenol oxidase [Populus alba x Populus x berolinensis]|nr:polyphenol oxidase [Populus alba x Populus x berolinensis]